MFGLFKKKIIMNGEDRLLCNKVEAYLITCSLNPFHDPNVPTHYKELERELDIDTNSLQELLKSNTHPCLQYLESSTYEKDGVWFVRLSAF